MEGKTLFRYNAGIYNNNNSNNNNASHLYCAQKCKTNSWASQIYLWIDFVED